MFSIIATYVRGLLELGFSSAFSYLSRERENLSWGCFLRLLKFITVMIPSKVLHDCTTYANEYSVDIYIPFFTIKIIL